MCHRNDQATRADREDYLQQYWEQQLRFSGSSFAHLSRQEQEARDIILNLITSYRTAKTDRQLAMQANIGGVATVTPREALRRSSQGAPAQALKAAPTTRCSVGKRVALATEAHLSNLPTLIASETHFAQGLATFMSPPCPISRVSMP